MMRMIQKLQLQDKMKYKKALQSLMSLFKISFKKKMLHGSLEMSNLTLL
jgi:hypothetical protein